MNSLCGGVNSARNVEMKLLPAQLREIVEAEQMAKASRGYESYDIQGDEAKK
ncbi:hypothetical protein GCK32_019716 [Trichostrongylus colubriformis]|uniref:Uncharacterized protein n=1 Tax=Trichostrongylus colubriformis TaxID=6319 RepID=A0AAN8FRV4_TRICO